MYVAPEHYIDHFLILRCNDNIVLYCMRTVLQLNLKWFPLILLASASPTATVAPSTQTSGKEEEVFNLLKFNSCI